LIEFEARGRVVSPTGSWKVQLMGNTS